MATIKKKPTKPIKKKAIRSKKKKTMRSDKKRNIDKVAAALVKKPLATQKELAKDTGLSRGTVIKGKKEVEQNCTKDARVISLTKKDAQIQSLIASIKLKKLSNAVKSILKGDKIDVSDSDINNWDKHSMGRHMALSGGLTDDKGALRPYQDLTIEEIEARLKELDG